MKAIERRVKRTVRRHARLYVKRYVAGIAAALLLGGGAVAIPAQDGLPDLAGLVSSAGNVIGSN